MKKQEYIKQKWQEAGFVWEEIESIVDEFGGLKLNHPSLKTSLTGYSEASGKKLLHGYAFDGSGLMVWNKLLDGVEHNNGWNKIESESDLPERNKLCKWLNKELIDCEFERTGGIDNYLVSEFTHWRPIVKIPNPLY
jgi:hypothetical protein